MFNSERYLLVEPEFPIPSKSKNHKNFLPIGLLKIACYLKSVGKKVKLIRGNKSKKYIGTRFNPEEIYITSLFTYWSHYVKQSVEHYRELYPNVPITVGGIYASLLPESCEKFTSCDKVFSGVIKQVEEYTEKNQLDYGLVSNPHPIEYQILHTSRGCKRKCKFCGTWKIEPSFISKESIKDEISTSKLIFYDNNLLANPHIDDILDELIEEKKRNRSLICESQSGFDGRILLDNPDLANKIKKAGFVYPRIAWDNGYSEHRSILKQIQILEKGGYNRKDISIFMIYNWQLPFATMEKKRKKCWEWGVQIADCRYRPLDQTFDNYDPASYRKGQTEKEYYINKPSGWTDNKIRKFRKNVRRQNICVRQGLEFYSKSMERKKISKQLSFKLRSMDYVQVKAHLSDAWSPVFA